MKIALLAPFEEPVPPEKYGGTELVVANIAAGLVEQGHTVHVLATGESKVAGNLIPLFPQAIRKDPLAQDANVRNALKIMGTAFAVEELHKLDIDIIHNHLGWRFVPSARQFPVPTITTLHGPLDIPYQQAIFNAFPEHAYVSISDAQRRPMPHLNFAATVYNGIDISKLEYSPTGGEYLAFLGRMSPEKGPRIAIEAAKKAGMKLKMAAKVDSVDKAYFTKEIEPLVDGDQIEFVGEIGPQEKSDFLRNAYALLAPIQWEEPFGLFMVEALACGTPVIARRRGSVPELITHGVDGFIAETDEEVAQYISKIASINRSVCRATAEKRFTVEAMTNRYLAVYETVISQSKHQ
jgi:glycosyltransferase involved in cell wall biosynthesis